MCCIFSLQVCHSVNRVCYLFGGIAKEPINEITPTLLTPDVLTTLRQCDHLAHQVSVLLIFLKLFDYIL